MTIDNISEIEFIGESLPKINNNFSELDSRAESLESDNTQYSGLSSFYSTHSNNSDISFSSNDLGVEYGSYNYTKSDIITDSGVSDVSKIMYPITVYLNLFNSSDVDDVKYSIRVRDTSTSTVKYFIRNASVSVANSNSILDESRSLITFVDIGYADWSINITGSTAKSNIYYSIKQLT